MPHFVAGLVYAKQGGAVLLAAGGAPRPPPPTGNRAAARYLQKHVPPCFFPYVLTGWFDALERVGSRAMWAPSLKESRGHMTPDGREYARALLGLADERDIIKLENQALAAFF